MTMADDKSDMICPGKIDFVVIFNNKLRDAHEQTTFCNQLKGEVFQFGNKTLEREIQKSLKSISRAAFPVWSGFYKDDFEGGRMTWAPGEPNGGPAENCLWISNEMWFDEDCSIKSSTICKLSEPTEVTVRSIIIILLNVFGRAV